MEGKEDCIDDPSHEAPSRFRAKPGVECLVGVGANPSFWDSFLNFTIRRTLNEIDVSVVLLAMLTLLLVVLTEREVSAISLEGVVRKISSVENVPYLKRPDFYVSIDELEKTGMPRAKIISLAKNEIVKAVYVNNTLMLSRAGVDAWLKEQESPTVPKRRGRPPKSAVAADASAPKRGRGRPRKEPAAQDSPAPRRRGRPVGSGKRAQIPAGTSGRTGRGSMESVLAGMLVGISETNTLLRELVHARKSEETDRNYLSASIRLIEGIFRTLDIELTKEERETIAKAMAQGTLGRKAGSADSK